MKKLLSILLTLALVVTLVPIYGTTTTVSASNNYFLFNNERSDKSSARVVSTSVVTLSGVLNNITGSSVSYKVEQITAGAVTDVLDETEDITFGISVNNNQITVANVILFPGLNRITFTGSTGTGTVSESIFIEYRDSPMLNNLQVSYNDVFVPIEETAATMLYRPANATGTNEVILSGFAPNASSVTVEVNGNSYTYGVSESSNFQFNTGKLVVSVGMNTIKFKVVNGGQVLETTRSLVLFGNSVVYYNENITQTDAATKTSPYMTNGEYTLPPNTTEVKYAAEVVVPRPVNDGTTDITDAAIFKDYLTGGNSSYAGAGKMTAEVNGVAVPVTVGAVQASADYFTFPISFTLASHATSITTAFDTPIKFKMTAPMGSATSTSNERAIILRDGSKPFLADVNILAGYDDSMVTEVSSRIQTTNPNQILAMQSSDIPSSGVQVYTTPMMLEVLIGNVNTALTVADVESMLLISPTAGATPTSPNLINYRVLVDSSRKLVSQRVTQQVNGQLVEYTRVFVDISSFKNAGNNRYYFSLNGTSVAAGEKAYLFNFMSGPYVKFDQLADGMAIDYHSQYDQKIDILEKLGGLFGRLNNVGDASKIKYDAGNQTVFLYLNNVAIPLEEQSTSNPTLFKPVGVEFDANGEITLNPDVQHILNIINIAGENTVKFVLYTDTFNFELTYKFTVVPTNLPIIPAPNTQGIFPYATTGTLPPTYSSVTFPKNGASYTTNESYVNVFGNFDFIDLNSLNDSSSVQNPTAADIIDTLSYLDRDKYIVSITSPEWSKPLNWNLNNEFYLVNENFELLDVSGNVAASSLDAVVINQGNPAQAEKGSIKFYYDVDAQIFYFILENQQMPEDGSTLVNVINVYNAGESGPRASYRFEINPISIPYTILSPIPENRITNQNFAEVIIVSAGAQSVTINKEEATKIQYITHEGGQEVYHDAFRVLVKDLKANKDTKIPFTITRGDQTLSQSLTVKYVPTNIPGAKFIQTMKNSHKVFDGNLTLTFKKNTNLIRSTYAQAQEYNTQVYNNHDILFAIANHEDGIIDRHMFEGVPANYTTISQQTGYNIMTTLFQNQASRFIKASNVFWIDAGLADDPIATPGSYDPIKNGLDPYPFPNQVGMQQLLLTSRYDNEERKIVPSTSGELTLAYDSNIVASAGTTVTVFHYDPVEGVWQNLGGVVDAKKGTITVPFTSFGYYVVAKLTRSYNDIIDHSYAREAMEAIFAKGVMNATSPTSQFGGDQYITRGEFTRMIVRALDLPLNYSGQMHFSYYPETITNANNPESIYDYRYIETAARAGIVNGTRPGFFDEAAQITRQDAAVILARALELKMETDSKKASQQLAKAFQDSGNFDFYSIPGVLAIQKKNFIVGIPIDVNDPKAGYMFQPKARLLRSDASIIMARVMADQKKLPAIYN